MIPHFFAQRSFLLLIYFQSLYFLIWQYSTNRALQAHKEWYKLISKFYNGNYSPPTWLPCLNNELCENIQLLQHWGKKLLFEHLNKFVILGLQFIIVNMAQTHKQTVWDERQS